MTDRIWPLQQGEARAKQLRQLLSDFNQDIPAQSRQAKYAKMAENPFVFFRGTAHVYYADLHARQVVQSSDFFDTSAVTWLQGDLHVENYGAFCDGQGEVIYDLNDFDESWIDSYLYDLYRLAASMVLVIEQLDVDLDWDKRELVAEMSQAYLAQLAHLQDCPQDKLRKLTADTAEGRLAKFLLKAEAKNSRLKMVKKWTNTQGDERRFDLSLDKLEAVDDATRKEIIEGVHAYHHRLDSDLKGDGDYFKVVDVAKRVKAGTGSLGTPRYYVLIDGESPECHDYRILDVKMQGEPSQYPFLEQAGLDRMHRLFAVDDQGSRVAQAQQAMHVHADDHLGSLHIHGQSYSVRERSPYKKTLDTAKLTSPKRFAHMARYWGQILATAHARAPRDFDSDLDNVTFESAVLGLTLGKAAIFDEHVFTFATDYASQVHEDHRLFLEVIHQL